MVETQAGVLGSTTAYGRGGVNGMDVTVPWWFLVTIENERITHIRSFLEQARALEAAGVPEQG